MYGADVWPENGGASTFKFGLGNKSWTANVVYEPTKGETSPTGIATGSTSFHGVSDSPIWS
jgi:hypothetical protein